MPLIERHPVLDFEHGGKVEFTFDGRTMEGVVRIIERGIEI
jgi:hypothetical protein